MPISSLQLGLWVSLKIKEASVGKTSTDALGATFLKCLEVGNGSFEELPRE